MLGKALTAEMNGTNGVASEGEELEKGTHNALHPEDQEVGQSYA